ncbi:MAG: hypothetical protein HOV68_17235, partial [Streptomycetaceae bacterium]|nr:hypothetical protein [Streptomycetaceae bacterium]
MPGPGAPDGDPAATPTPPATPSAALSATPAARDRPAPVPPTLVRPRLTSLLDAVRDHRPVLLAAPVGHGKTTLLDQYAAAWRGPVVRVQFAPGDAQETPATPQKVRRALLARVSRPGTLLVLDDLHHLPDAARTFELLAAARPGGPDVRTDAPPTAPHLLVASRPLPALNLSRAELAHTVVVGPDDLRLRWWEVDRLFTDVHGRPADPGLAWDATWLTGGWAAPLHEFLLCVRDLSPRQARRTLTAAGVPFAAGYLDRQILDELDPDLRVFLMRIAIYPEPTAADCAVADTPAARAASAALLRRAERAGILVRRGAGYVGETLLRHVLVHRLATTSRDALPVFAAAAERLRAKGDPVGAAWAAFLARDRAALRDIMDRNPVLIAAALPEHWHALLSTFAGPAHPTDHQAARLAAGDLGVLTGLRTQPPAAVPEPSERVGDDDPGDIGDLHLRA